ncbi:MAG: rod shape-determining protein MreD, partial [Actinomycetia bacterium]|nr:rod shape-determining protein MreD [Actinomycetes bacterium]
EDALSGSIFGMHALSKAIIAYLAGKLKGKIVKQSQMLVTVIIFFSTIFKGIISLILMAIFSENIQVGGRFTSIVFPEAFYNAVLGPVIFILLDKVSRLDISKMRKNKYRGRN